MKTSRFLLAATAIMAFGVAHAATAATPIKSAPTGSVVRSTLDGHAYQNGGIGKEQVADMQRHMKPYDLRLRFSEGKHNAYLTGLKLDITSRKGETVFSLNDAGPLTDVSLPVGHYKVVADFGGVRRVQAVEIKPSTPTNLSLHWPKSLA